MGASARQSSILGSLLVPVVYACVFLLPMLIGCGSPTSNNTVIARAQSPDGRNLALLVDRRYDAARISDGFFLIVVPTSRDVNKAINTSDIDKLAALVATSAGNVQLQWQNDNTLIAICDSCGLTPIDISRKLDHIGSIRVMYHGFPDHTAYS